MDKKFYIIGVSRPIDGLFALLHSVINHCIYAEKQGYIPIVDMKHYSNQYFKDNREYKDNVWEYFFEQPAGYTLDVLDENSKIVISKNVLYSDCETIFTNDRIPKSKYSRIDRKSEYLRLKYRAYYKPKKDIVEYLENGYKSVIPENSEVLGVLCRGTDYLEKRPKGEQVQPHWKDVIKEVKKMLKRHPEIDKIYLATEDDNIYNEFRKVFGDKLLENSQYKYSYDKKESDFLADIKVDRENHNYNLAKEYYLSIYILSKCKYFVGGRTTGTKWVWILADKWEDFYVWKLGKYGTSILEKIYSVSTVNDSCKKHKVYTIFGIKIKKSMN